MANRDGVDDTVREVTLRLSVDEPTDDDEIRTRVAEKLEIPESELPPTRIVKRSVDARHHRVSFEVIVEVGGAAPQELGLPHPKKTRDHGIVIIGGGPAGLFCAYELARRGIGSTILDRGKHVQPRRHDLKALNQGGTVNPDSNYCFGEGGAGTYSDGKLYTRAHKRGNVRDVIEILARHGAPEEILSDARPHIGSNRLPKVVTSIREELESVGVRFHFGARVEKLLFAKGPTKAIRGVLL
ncbi:MAG: FAD-dependent oxidoreductase, partial [Myxococcales bacterium]|nr:FAD-dependent oxidoreductase [Myxococcales bacterium]